MEKVCAKCKKLKFLEDFYIDKKNKDGLNKWCKVCISKYQKQNYKNNDEFRTRQKQYTLNCYHEKYKGTDELKLRNLKYSLNNVEKMREARRKWEKNNKRDPLKHCQQNRNWENNHLKRRAKNALNRKVRRGTMTKGSCGVCGTTENVHGHHEDYSKPFEVIWFCRKHHWELHNRKRDQLRIQEIERLEAKFA